jgi:hypothetical protein
MTANRPAPNLPSLKQKTALIHPPASKAARESGEEVAEPARTRADEVPKHISELPRTLGTPFAEFKPGTANSIAGIILSLILLCAGVLLVIGAVFRPAGPKNFDVPIKAEEGPSWIIDGFVCIAGISLIGGGAFRFRWVLSL